MERDSRPSRRRALTLRKGPENREMLIQMKAFCTTTVATGGLMKEFNEIRATSVPPSQLTRVVLNYPPKTNDYIHANWVDVVSIKRRFICTQSKTNINVEFQNIALNFNKLSVNPFNDATFKAPKENTVEDFWRMVWQEDCHSIVMLCNIIESGKKKCEQYWPAEEAESVTCNRVIQEEKTLTISNLIVTNGSKKLSVEHIAWNDWPDRGVPNNFLAPFRLLQRIKNQTHVVIHCSADTMFNDGMKVTMRDVVRELRLQRHGSVQTDIQYVYIHRCILALSENRKA
ncbi:Protein-tyrosine phosphatase [Onchocerca flexuosa]|uniref:Protein-tyrosine phosphatase n=1 Tax=Onchocerca flexuosa TaxID=387005 RepID=A0A238BNM9_9BILA|nr:Protein-tyrosine phosphatase [Onchocerca flexuosa]